MTFRRRIAKQKCKQLIKQIANGWITEITASLLWSQWRSTQPTSLRHPLIFLCPSLKFKNKSTQRSIDFWEASLAQLITCRRRLWKPSWTTFKAKRRFRVFQPKCPFSAIPKHSSKKCSGGKSVLFRGMRRKPQACRTFTKLQLILTKTRFSDLTLVFWGSTGESATAERLSRTSRATSSLNWNRETKVALITNEINSIFQVICNEIWLTKSTLTLKASLTAQWASQKVRMTCFKKATPL